MRSIARTRLVLLATLLFLAAPLPAQAEYKKHYRSDMEAFLDEVQKSYPFFDLKDLRKDWKATAKRLEKAAKKCKSDVEFIELVGEGIACLRDGHMRFTECAVELPPREPEWYPGVSFLPATEGRVVVMHPPEGQGAGSLPTGAVVLQIDGKDARKFLEARAEEAWAAGGSFSTRQRARLFEYRIPLRGERGDKHVLTIQDGRKKKKVTVSARQEVSGWPRSYHMPEGLVQGGKSVWFTRLESGFGYLYLRRVDSSLPDGIAKALAEYADASGWVVDLRGNSGGGYGSELLAQVEAVTGPVAVILDAGCISAGETLARDFVNRKQARLFGLPTAGSSSSKRDWSFPSGIATIKFSTRSRGGLNGQPIEGRGIEPDVLVEVVPEEAQAGQNSAILRAEEWLREQAEG